MKKDNATHTAGVIAILVLGSLSFSASGALAAERHHRQETQQQQARDQNNHRNNSRRDERRAQQPQHRPKQRENAQKDQRTPARTQPGTSQRRQNLEQNRGAQESANRRKIQRDRARRQQVRNGQAQRQKAQRDSAKRQQTQRQQVQRDRRHSDTNRSRHVTQARPQRRDDHRDRNQINQRHNNDRYHVSRRVVRMPGWNHWRQRYYISAPRYHWRQDRYSRPWFDYNRSTYISIYRPTYIIPAYGYRDYSSSYYGPVGCGRDVVGAVLGGVAGGLIGAHNGGGQATLGGAIIGALLGGTLGHAIDLSDQACYGQVLEYVPSNQPVYWESDGTQYQVTPLRTYQTSSGEYCREYQTYIYIDGREEQAYGTACRQPDGAWRANN